MFKWRWLVKQRLFFLQGQWWQYKTKKTDSIKVPVERETSWQGQIWGCPLCLIAAVGTNMFQRDVVSWRTRTVARFPFWTFHPPCWREPTFAQSQHRRQNEPIKQMASDSCLAIACEDVNKRKASVSDPTQFSQQRPRLARRKRLRSPNKHNKRKHASGWENNDVWQITINTLTLYGYIAQSQKT